MKITYKKEVTENVTHLQADCGVRYWEDATVNGVEDSDGSLIPCREGDSWNILIEIETGKIVNWPAGCAADIHYKVCDAGVYRLLDEKGAEIICRDGYVPSMLSPGGSGYGDYVIMKIDESGQIGNWSADLSYFSDDED